MPKTEEHCVAIEISDDDIRNSVTLISKLSSLVSSSLFGFFMMLSVFQKRLMDFFIWPVVIEIRGLHRTGLEIYNPIIDFQYVPKVPGTLSKKL